MFAICTLMPFQTADSSYQKYHNVSNGKYFTDIRMALQYFETSENIYGSKSFNMAQELNIQFRRCENRESTNLTQNFC